ncbi:GspH/FimT family pseudopilin [Dyella soli]|uniref:Type II secretion system protein H n=1 Tax=Dyella soli TaxID=522319 RepID=A0A4R0YX00_9GAMM|nr:GspH/FimT family pseudopilin [Dyella soli]TCI10910.1 pilus assembly protein [Dyella soli]
MKHRRGQDGFTLIEQIVCAAIVLALSCMAAPALGQLLSRNQLQAAQSDLLAALGHARALAAHSGRRAMLCPSRDGEHCVDGLNWEDGWLSGHYRSGRTDQLDGPPSRASGGYARLTILSTAGRRNVRFQADGSAGGSTVTFTLCRQGRADGALGVVVANSGRVRSATATAEQAERCAHGG